MYRALSRQAGSEIPEHLDEDALRDKQRLAGKLFFNGNVTMILIFSTRLVTFTTNIGLFEKSERQSSRICNRRSSLSSVVIDRTRFIL
jgi:hypothetical protein